MRQMSSFFLASGLITAIEMRPLGIINKYKMYIMPGNVYIVSLSSGFSDPALPFILV